jgi:cytochrome oxidase Cu insertion factor (SCO1/SenC/PrrC family)
MNMVTRTVLAGCLLCLVTLTPAFANYQVGDTVADFTLPDAYGNPVSFSDFEGMVVVVNFWTPG